MIGERPVTWAMFSLILALVSVIVDYLRARLNRVAAPLGASIGRGELLLITAGLCGAAVGELVGAGPTYKIDKILAGGAVT